MHIYVFSYNRGIFLDNCLKSIQKCAFDYDATVVDDHSSDNYTLEVLKKWEKIYSVITPAEEVSDYKIGGLYGNMNYAMNDAQKKKYKYALFIQDDMQLVRNILQKDIKMIEKYFNENKKCVQYYPCFFKSYTKKNKNNRSLNNSKIVYFKKIELQYSGFSAIGVFQVKRFKKLFDKFEKRERTMDNKARKKGIQKGEAVYPFMSYLPHPVSYRNKRKSFVHLLTEKISGAGFYPIDYMDEESIKILFYRDPNLIPYAEDYLNAPGIKSIPWSFAGGVTALYEQGGLRRVIGRIIKRFDSS